MKTPVYSLKPGDTFIAPDNLPWIVDEVHEPSNWRTNLQIGEAVSAFTILAHRGQKNQRFYLKGSKIVERSK